MNTVTNSIFSGDCDFFAMRSMLIEGYVLAGRPCNMFFYYLDNWRYANGDEPEKFFAERAVIWRDGNAVAAFSILGNESLYNLQLHPRYYFVVPEILHYLRADRGIVRTAVYEHQTEIIGHLEAAGFGSPRHVSNEYEYDLEIDIEHVYLPRGYVIRAASALDNLTTVYRAKANAFGGPNMTEEACALRMELKQKAPSYSNDSVFLVLRESDMSCVSFAMAWVDPLSKVVGFEPVGTVKECRRNGLCKALLTYVFAKYRAEGYRKISIRTGADYHAPANYLYRSLRPAQTYPIMEYSYSG